MSAKAMMLILVVLPALASEVGQSNVVSMSEYSIRRVATKKPLPAYPAESVPKKSAGVAVAAITSGVDGRIANVTILEAPDEAIAAAVRTALLGWEIPATTVMGRPEQYGIRGKVTFYFAIVSGRGHVANPEDFPGGPKPEPAGGPPASPPGVRSAGGGALPAVVTHDQRTAEEIDEAGLARLLAARPGPILLDIRERPDFKRRHRDGAINIPRDELAVRGWIEIDRAKAVVIDCSQADMSQCRQAASLLMGGPKPARVLIFVP